jgi:hypothetical protein
MNESPEEILERALARGDQLLWSGRPPRGIMFRLFDIFLIPFSLIWGGGAIVWETGVLSTGAPWFFALWGIPFVLVGLYLIVGRFWVDARIRASTCYGVTSERIIFVCVWPSRKIKSLELRTLTEVTLTEWSTGGGTITFGPEGWYMGAGMGRFSRGPAPSPLFELAEDAQSVYALLREAQREARERPAPDASFR